MQNVVNLNSRFIDKDGQSITAGRVKFVSPSSDSEYIVIKNKSGINLKNPLPLNDKGYFSEQPFVSDGIDYKMIVERDTGIPAEYGSEETTVYEVVDTIYSFHEEQTVNIGGSVTCVGTIEELRALDTALGKAIVLGYNSANDDCPERMFVFKNEQAVENYGTVIKVAVGAWIFNNGMPVDVRYFGLFGNESESCHAKLKRAYNAASGSAVKTLYIPSGTYKLSVGFNFTGVNVILEKGVVFENVSDVLIILTFGSVENNGATFGARCFPVFSNGTLYTSCIGGNIEDYFSEPSRLGKIETIVFDKVNGTSGTNVTISNANIVKKVSVPSNIKFDNCIVRDCLDGNSLKYVMSNGYLKISNDGLSSVTSGGHGFTITKAGVANLSELNTSKITATGNIETEDNLAVIKNILCSGEIKNYDLRNEWSIYADASSSTAYIPLPFNLKEGKKLRFRVNSSSEPQENSIGLLVSGNWIFPELEWESEGNNLYKSVIDVSSDYAGCKEIKSNVTVTISQNYS